jgi:hypothetical protein
MADPHQRPSTPDPTPRDQSSNSQRSVTISEEQYQQLLAASRGQQQRQPQAYQDRVGLPYQPFQITDGRTGYASFNSKSGASFVATAPVGSRYAKQLREMTAAVQGESMSDVEQMAVELQRAEQFAPAGRQLEYAQDHRCIEAVPEGQQADEERQDGQNPQTVNRIMNTESSPTALEWLTRKLKRGVPIERHETESEVMYYRQTSKGYCVVTAPIGSEEAGLYDMIMKIVKPRQVSSPVPLER